jgi:hypothetical protein
MKLCPIAIVVGCKKCPAFKICPVKGLIGDAPPAPAVKAAAAPKPRKTAARKKK